MFFWQCKWCLVIIQHIIGSHMNNALRNVSNVFPSIKLLQDDETSFIMYLFLIINEDWSFIWSNVDHHHSSVAQKKKKRNNLQRAKRSDYQRWLRRIDRRVICICHIIVMTFDTLTRILCEWAKCCTAFPAFRYLYSNSTLFYGQLHSVL